ncbi:MAG: hypothetical protein JWM04_1736 [Verrucomicrobiales bacterium]|nr:hypothetical protein [Verrucomicrobiales bacterium]
MTAELAIHFQYNPEIASHLGALGIVKSCLKGHPMQQLLLSFPSKEANRASLVVVVNGSPRLFPGPFDDYFVLSFLETMFKCYVKSSDLVPNPPAHSSPSETSDSLNPRGEQTNHRPPFHFPQS